jgi:hypothetical protein
MHGTSPAVGRCSVSLLQSLITGLDDRDRNRTLGLIAQQVADEREHAAVGRHHRQVDVGVRRRRSRRPRPTAASAAPCEPPHDDGLDRAVPPADPTGGRRR